MKAFGWRWEWRDWSLSKRDPNAVDYEGWLGIFSLRCAVCTRWSLGCGDPECDWFCGVCRACLTGIKKEEDK
jgi:hypothetical protein